MKIGLLQLNSTIGDFDANARKLKEGYQRACQSGAELVVAPEMFLCGYPPRDLLLRKDFIVCALRALEELARSAGEVPLLTGYVDRHEKRPGKPLRNAAAILQNGRVLERVWKTLLPTYDVFDEARYFEPAEELKPFVYRNRRIALTICEDIWNDQDFWPERLYRRDPVKELIAQGADLIVNLSASPWHQKKEQVRFSMLQRRAADEQLPLVQVNLVGGNDELVFDGHSVVFNARGRPLAMGRGFEEDLLLVDLTEEKSAPEIHWPPAEEQLYRALSLGLRDYVRKCGFKSVVVGLSGGIDSALAATLAVEALGSQNVLGVAMPSKFSSQGSLRDAKQLAANLGIRLEVIAIEHSVEAVEASLGPLFASLPRNEAEENIQSRLRGLTLMAISNKFGSLVLTTGNKSELSVGYCTLYGDMCGALGVIADLLKTEVYQLARWINRDKEIIPVESITKPPSAELRPGQTDQDSLPPYDILDDILRAYVVQDLAREQIIQRSHNPAVVADVLNRVISSEYKRRQAAPGLKVSPRAFGTGRRIPIAQKFRN